MLVAGEMQGFVDHPEQWPFLPVLERFGMAVAIGLVIGLEREFSGKMGARTFALTAVLRRLKKHDQLATTTSISFTIVAFCGILFGAGRLHARPCRHRQRRASYLEKTD
jgi:hypothetical protein